VNGGDLFFPVNVRIGAPSWNPRRVCASWEEGAGQKAPTATAFRVFVSRDGNLGLTGLELRLEIAGGYYSPVIEPFVTQPSPQEVPPG